MTILKEISKRAVRKALRAINKKRAYKKQLATYKSTDRYGITAGGSGTKSPVPIKRQSKIKSTLSGRTYSISSNKLSSKTMLDIGGGYGQTNTARFQDAVKDLIGLDKLSIRKAYKRGLKKKK